MCNFVPLHCHTEYSLLDGLSQIKPLIKRVKEYEMPACAITDHGVMYGAIEFYKACKDNGVKPIIGVEAYVSKGPHTEKDPNKKANSNHLLLLAKNHQGYKNLMTLSSIAHLDGFYYRPRFDKETLAKYSEGLICTSACPAGEIAEFIIAGDLEGARKAIQWYLDVFKENYYLEIQRHEYHKFLPNITDATIRADIEKIARHEQLINDNVTQLSREFGIPLVATNDSHYIDRSDAPAQDALVCVSTGTTVDVVNRLRYIDTPSFHVRSPQEMTELFQDFPDSVSNTVDVAAKCELELTLGKWFFPKSTTIPENQTEESYLRELISQLAPEKMGEITPDIQKRIDFELDTICGKGYAGYFIIMREFAHWTAGEGIITNTRGSAAGSLVSYILGITTVDPIKYYLPFERFLNPFRPSPPDIDLDIADNKRQDMIEYITRTFGQEKVAQICTFGRMMARGSVKDIARALGYPYEVGDRLSKAIPMGSQGFPMTIERALEETPELKATYTIDPDAHKIIDLARKVEGNARHISIHAAAVVVAPQPITDYAPLQRESQGDKVITQYEMHAAEDVGLIKFDILGITQLSIMGNAIKLIEQTRGEKIQLEKVPLDDAKTFDMLSAGGTLGVFQLGGSGMTKWLMELRAERVEDLMAMIALYRPGPMAIIPEYIARKRGERPTIYYHPKMEKFLAPSYGLLVYQDDLLFTALELAGYDWESVDKFRKAVGKKIPEEMAKQHIKFVEGCQKYSEMTEAQAEGIWNLFEPFQGYGFNKAHAASYGMVSYRSAYLKANYPVEFMTAMLTADAGDTDKITAGIEECRRMDIVVLPPDINSSETGFTIEPNDQSLNNQAIRFGLSAIKNVGAAAIDVMLEARNSGGPFNSLTEFLTRVDPRKANKKVLESLIRAGAMDAFGSRAALLQAVDEIKKKVEARGKSANLAQASLFEDSTTEEDNVMQLTDNLPNIPEFSLEQRLAMERELLGFYLTENPMQRRYQLIAAAISHQISDLDPETHINKVVKIGGTINQIRIVTTKKNNQQMAFAKLADISGTIDLVIFPKLYAETKDHWAQDRLVVVEGKVDLREESLNLIVDRFSVVNHQTGAVENGDAIHQLLVPRGTSSSQLMQVNNLLKQYPGDEHLIFLFENGGPIPKTLKVPYGIEFTPKLHQEILHILTR